MPPKRASKVAEARAEEPEKTTTVLPERLLMRNVLLLAATNVGTYLSPEQVELIERGCFNKTIYQCRDDGVDRTFANKIFVERYSNRIYHVASCITPEMVERLNNNKYDINTLYAYSVVELAPETSARERADLDSRLSQKIEKKVSNEHRCRKCGGNETTYEEHQYRSADEPSTTVIECINCGNKWHK